MKLVFFVLYIVYLSIPAAVPTASWYTRESTIKDGNLGICANGEVMKDNSYICASWDYPFGTYLRVTNCKNNKSVIVRVCDRGPSKILYKNNRRIDLSKKAFSNIANLDKGVIPVKIKTLHTKFKLESVLKIIGCIFWIYLTLRSKNKQGRGI